MNQLKLAALKEFGKKYSVEGRFRENSNLGRVDFRTQKVDSNESKSLKKLPVVDGHVLTPF